jgi:hypothetical protein
MQSLEELRAAISKAAGPSAVLNDNQIDRIIDVMVWVISNDLLSLRQVAAELNINLSAANMRAHRKSLPPSVAKLGTGRVWTRWDVEAYKAQNVKVIRHHDVQEAS